MRSRLAKSAIAALIALLFLGLGLSAPLGKDQEPQSAQWIADIVHNGNWLLPVDYYGAVERKPPFFYWLSALGADAAGGRVNQVTTRAVSLIAGSALAVEVMLWTASALGEAGGLLAFLFLLGSYGFAARATVALTDMLMTFLIFSAYILLWPLIEHAGAPGAIARAKESGEKSVGPPSPSDSSATEPSSRSRALMAGVVLGLAVLTKGPVAIVLVALAIAIYLAMVRRWPWQPLRLGWPWIVLATALVVSALWYVPAFAAGWRSGLPRVFIDENFGHFMPASMGGTGEAARPAYYIVMRLLGATLPLCLLVLELGLMLVQADFSNTVRRALIFQSAMLVAVIALFSIAAAKRDDYILPAIPSLAILLAALFTIHPEPAAGRSNFAARLRDLTVQVIALVVAVGVAWAVVVLGYLASGSGYVSDWVKLQSSDASYAAFFAAGIAQRKWPFVIFAVASFAGAMVALAGVRRRLSLIAGAGLAIVSLAGTGLWIGTLRTEVARSRSLGPFAVQVRDRIGDAPLYVAEGWDYELSYYYGKAVPPFFGFQRKPHLRADSTIYFVARPSTLSMLLPALDGYRLELIFRADTIGGGGPPALYALKAPAPGLNAAAPSNK